MTRIASHARRSTPGGGAQKQAELWVRKLGMGRTKWVENLAFTQNVKGTLAAMDMELGCRVSESVVIRGTARKRAPSLSSEFKHVYGLYGWDEGVGLSWEIE